MGHQLLDGLACGLQILPGVKVRRMQSEVLPDGGGHGQTQIGVDVDLAHGQGGSLAQLILGHADGAGHIAAILVYLGHQVLGHGGRSVQHDGEAGQTAGDLLQHVEAQLGLGAGLKLISAVAGADGDGQRVAPGLGHELLHLLGVGIGGILGGHVDLILNAGQGTQLGLHHHAVVMGILHHLTGQGNVLGKGLGGGVDHNGGEAAVDASLAGLKVGAVVQMEHNGDLRALQHSSFHQLHQVGVVGVGPGTLGHLEDYGSFLFPAGFRDALHNFHVVDVESADGVAAVVGLFEHFGRSYQRHCKHSLSFSGGHPPVF